MLKPYATIGYPIRESPNLIDETPETIFWLSLTEAQCSELMAGRVPELVADQARSMVEWSLETGPTDYVGRRQRQQHGTRTPRKAKA